MIRRSRLLPRQLLAVPIAVLVVPAWAQGTATPPQTVTITASRGEQPVAYAASAVSTVSKEELARGNAVTLDQAVAGLPGVFAKRSKGLLDTLGGVQIRGVPDDNRTLVLLDGLPLNDGYTGGVRLGGLELAGVERIEVVRGPASSLYGGNAMGGVVQVITRMPVGTEAELSASAGGALDSDWGLQGQRSLSFSGGTAFAGGWSVRLTAVDRHADGYRSDLVTGTATPPAAVTGAVATTTNTGGSTRIFGERGANRWDDAAASLALQWQPAVGQTLRLTVAQQGYEYGYGAPLTYLLQAGQAVYAFSNGASVLREAAFTAGGGETQRRSTQLRWDARAGAWRFNVAAASIRLDTNGFVTPDATLATLAGGPGRRTDTPSRTDLLDLQADWQPAAGQRLVFGGALRRDRADVTERAVTDWRDIDSATGNALYEAHGRTETRALFAQHEWRFAPEWTGTLGLRWDAWTSSDGRSDDRNASGVSKAGFPKAFAERSDSALSPKLALVWQASESISWRASAGRAFRAPAMYDLYRTWISSAGTIFASNPELTPETVRSLDLGVTQRLAPGLAFTASVFRNDLRDLIYRRTVTDLAEARALCGPTATASNCRHFINAGRARSDGFEFELRQDAADLGWYLNATMLDTRILENRFAPNSVGKQFTGVPTSLINAGFNLTMGSWKLAVAARSQDKAYRNDDNGDLVEGVYGGTDARTVCDAKLRWQAHKALELSLAVDNLFDRRYYDFYRGVGRSWTLQARASY